LIAVLNSTTVNISCRCTYYAVDLIHSSNEDKAIWCLTTLNNELYVRHQGKDITVYDTQTYSVQRTLQIPCLSALNDMTSCIRHQCIYIADNSSNVIHRIENKNKLTQWAVNDEPHGLSVNSAYNVLVTCSSVGKIKEFTTDGRLIREIQLQSDVVHPKHAVEMTTDQFVVCHGERNDPLHRVCVVDSNGFVLRSYGGSKGSANGLLNMPVRIVVNGFIFVSDLNNHRIIMLNSALEYIRDVVTGIGWPTRICLDEHNGRLYVADNKVEMGIHVAGQVKVFNIHT
jgi:hypothetical protein